MLDFSDQRPQGWEIGQCSAGRTMEGMAPTAMSGPFLINMWVTKAFFFHISISVWENKDIIISHLFEKPGAGNRVYDHYTSRSRGYSEIR